MGETRPLSHTDYAVVGATTWLIVPGPILS